MPAWRHGLQRAELPKAHDGWPTLSRWLDPPPFELVFFVPDDSEGALPFAESAVLVFALAAKGGMR